MPSVLDNFRVETVNYDGGAWLECLVCRESLVIHYDYSLTEVNTLATNHWSEGHEEDA
jgi:hypothetical protein